MQAGNTRLNGFHKRFSLQGKGLPGVIQGVLVIGIIGESIQGDEILLHRLPEPLHILRPVITVIAGVSVIDITVIPGFLRNLSPDLNQFPEGLPHGVVHGLVQLFGDGPVILHAQVSAVKILIRPEFAVDGNLRAAGKGLIVLLNQPVFLLDQALHLVAYVLVFHHRVGKLFPLILVQHSPAGTFCQFPEGRVYPVQQTGPLFSEGILRVRPLLRRAGEIVMDKGQGMQGIQPFVF